MYYTIRIRTNDTGRNFEPIFMKFARLVRVRPWVNPIVFGNNRSNSTTDKTENEPPIVYWSPNFVKTASL